MATVQDVLDALERIAPSRYAFSFDRIGLQIGDPSATVSRVVVSLDPSVAAASFAREEGAQMLVSHHPVIWDPLASVRLDTHKGRVVRTLIEGGVAFAAAHTNWDCAPGGINDVLAEQIGLSDVRPIGSVSDKEKTKIAVNVPKGTEQAVIDALSAAGAGVIGLYERCAFSVDGEGTFRALPGADPLVGDVGQIERVIESRIEMVCPAALVDAAVSALIEAHPYEEPAYDVFPVKSLGGQPISRIGDLPSAMDPVDFCSYLDERLQTKSLLCSGGRAVRRVVVCGGAAADEWKSAVGVADAFVTGEVPHHLMVEASESGVTIAAAGHFATENPGAMRLGELIAQETGLDVVKFFPGRGQSGRP